MEEGSVNQFLICCNDIIWYWNHFFLFSLEMHVLKCEIFRIMKVLKMIACKLLEWILEPSLGSSDWLRIVKNRFWRFEGQIHREWDFFFFFERERCKMIFGWLLISCNQISSRWVGTRLEFRLTLPEVLHWILHPVKIYILEFAFGNHLL